MATANTIVKHALLEIGVLASGEAIDASDAEDMFQRLNWMLDEWNTERLMVYQITDDTYTLVVDQADYTIGESGSPDFSAVRPVKIENANVLDTTITPNERIPIDILDKNRFAERYVVDSFQYPSALYYEPSYPNGTIHLFHSPTVAYSLELFTWTPLTAFTALTDTVSLPPGYESALMYNLAERASTMFGRPVPAFVSQMAAKTRAKIASVNAPVPYMDAVGVTMPGEGRRIS